MTAKELAPETWPDYEALFGKYDGVRGGCWCAFYHVSSKEFDGMTRAQRNDLKQRLVLKGLAHGILVYDADTPIGWMPVRTSASIGWSRAAARRTSDMNGSPRRARTSPGTVTQISPPASSLTIAVVGRI